MSSFARLVVAVLALGGLAAAIGALAFARSGVSAREAPPAFETSAARWMRHVLIPQAARRAENPLPATAESLAQAKEHFVDHCAVCHGLDGRGDTEVGRGLYPRAPDMTLAATQALSDGELFWIIENGVKLTGMPAWGKEAEDDDEHAWSLVHWIRHLPELSPEEIRQMQDGEDLGAPAESAPSSPHEHHHEHTHP